MAVTKMSVVSVFVVLAITYNQGAARPMACTTAFGSSSSEESQWDCKYKIPTVVKQGLGIHITGKINPETPNKALIVELSKNGKDSCQFKYNFSNQKISVKSSLSFESEPYELDVTPPEDSETTEGPSFSLLIMARQDMFMISFVTQKIGQSIPLFCKIDNFEDINQIDIIDGVARVTSLLFQFGSK